MNVLALGDTFQRVGLDIADDIVEVAKTELEKPPSTAQLYEIARRVRDDQALVLPPVLLDGPDGVPMPDWVKEKYVGMVEATDPLTRQREREARTEASTAESVRQLAALRAGARMRGVCNGVGQQPIVRDGKRVCPDCGVEVPDIEVRVPKPRRTRVS